MVMENNKVCGQCKIGRQRIKARRTEIDQQMHVEAIEKAKRAAKRQKNMKKRGSKKCKAA